MKKIILIITIIAMATFETKGFAAGTKRSSSKNSKSVTTAQKAKTKKSEYEKALLERMNALEKEKTPGMESGVTADMINATTEVTEGWRKEMNTLYELIMQKLPENKKANFKAAQEKWEKGINQRAEKETEEYGGTMKPVLYASSVMEIVKERTLELVKMYNNLN